MKFILFAITLSFLFVPKVFGQLSWAPTNGPYGAYCNKLNLINNEVYCATTCGVYSTNDNGLSWTSRNNGLDDCVNFLDIEKVSNVLIAGTANFGGSINYEPGIYLSNDNGLNWTKSNTGLLDGSPFEDLHLCIRDIFINGTDILIGTQDGVFKSTNQGQTWAPSNIGINEPNNVQALHFVKFGNAIFLQTANDIYRSMDNGFTWIDLNNNFGAQPFTLVANATGLFVSGSLGLYKSTNNGNSWSILSNNLPDIPSTIFESNNNLYCGVPNIGTYFSTNNGASWALIGYGYYTDFLYVNNTHYMCSGNGVYSAGSGLSLNNCGLGGANATMTLFVDGNDIYAGTANGIYKSTDDGTIWKNMRTYLPIYTQVKCMTKSGNNLIIGTKDSGIYISNDNGNTWIQSNTGLVLNGVNCWNITMLYKHNGKVFLGAKQNTNFYDNAALFVSTNNGQSWSPVTTGLGDDFNISSMTAFGNYLILGTKTEFSPPSFADGVYLSTDNGDSWLFDGLDLPITDVASDNNSYYAVSGSSVYSTQNMGNSWDEVQIGGGSFPITNIEKLNSLLVIQTAYNGIMYLNNGNWTQMGGFGILSGHKAICQKQNGSIFIGASAYTNANNGNITYVDNGVSKYIGGISGLVDSPQPETISIYPNPMNSKTTLEITNDLLGLNYTLIDQFGKVLLESKIQDLFTEIDLSNYSKGVYYLKLDNPSVGIKKIIKQ
jgi:photosystem II stability/assembly factor-like uncharacterized protein